MREIYFENKSHLPSDDGSKYKNVTQMIVARNLIGKSNGR